MSKEVFTLATVAFKTEIAAVNMAATLPFSNPVTLVTSQRVAELVAGNRPTANPDLRCFVVLFSTEITEDEYEFLVGSNPGHPTCHQVRLTPKDSAMRVKKMLPSSQISPDDYGEAKLQGDVDSIDPFAEWD